MQDTIAAGDRVYVATDRAYYGRGTVVRMLDYDATIKQQTWLVKMDDGRRGRIAADQIHATRADAQAKARTTIFHR